MRHSGLDLAIGKVVKKGINGMIIRTQIIKDERVEVRQVLFASASCFLVSIDAPKTVEDLLVEDCITILVDYVDIVQLRGCPLQGSEEKGDG